MNHELERLLKSEMNYTETLRYCADCDYYTQLEFKPYCNFNNIGEIRVNDRGMCDHWKGGDA